MHSGTKSPEQFMKAKKTWVFIFFKKEGCWIKNNHMLIAPPPPPPPQKKLGNIQFAPIVTALREWNIDGNSQITYHLTDIIDMYSQFSLAPCVNRRIKPNLRSSTKHWRLPNRIRTAILRIRGFLQGWRNLQRRNHEIKARKNQDALTRHLALPSLDLSLL